MGRAENIIVFEDTVERCRDSQRLMESIRESCDSQVVVLESAEVPDGRRRALEQPRFSQPAQLVLTKERTFQAAEKYVRNPLYQDKRICVLNFAGKYGLCLYAPPDPGKKQQTNCSYDQPRLFVSFHLHPSYSLCSSKNTRNALRMQAEFDDKKASPVGLLFFIVQQ